MKGMPGKAVDSKFDPSAIVRGKRHSETQQVFSGSARRWENGGPSGPSVAVWEAGALSAWLCGSQTSVNGRPFGLVRQVISSKTRVHINGFKNRMHLKKKTSHLFLVLLQHL